jgi:hypothetical protein
MTKAHDHRQMVKPEIEIATCQTILLVRNPYPPMQIDHCQEDHHPCPHVLRIPCDRNAHVRVSDDHLKRPTSPLAGSLMTCVDVESGRDLQQTTSDSLYYPYAVESSQYAQLRVDALTLPMLLRFEEYRYWTIVHILQNCENWIVEALRILRELKFVDDSGIASERGDRGVGEVVHCA